MSLARKKILNLNELEKQICESEGLSFGLWWKPNTTTVQNWGQSPPQLAEVSIWALPAV